MRTPADEEPIEELDVDAVAVAVPIEPSAFMEDATAETAEAIEVGDVVEATEAIAGETVEAVIEESRV